MRSLAIKHVEYRSHLEGRVGVAFHRYLKAAARISAIRYVGYDNHLENKDVVSPSMLQGRIPWTCCEARGVW